MIGDGLYGKKFCIQFKSKEYKVFNCLLSMNLKDTATPEKPRMVTPPHTKTSAWLFGSTLVVSLYCYDRWWSPETAGAHALFFVNQISTAFWVYEKSNRNDDNRYKSSPSWLKSISNNMFARWVTIQKSISDWFKTNEKFGPHTSNRLSARIVLPWGITLSCEGWSVDWVVAHYQLLTGIFIVFQSHGLAFYPHPIYGICSYPFFSD